MALHSLYCADVPLRNCSLTHSQLHIFLVSTLLSKMFDVGDRDLPVPISGN